MLQWLVDVLSYGCHSHNDVVHVCLLRVRCAVLLLPQPPSRVVNRAHPHHWSQEAAGDRCTAAALLGAGGCCRGLEGLL